MLKKYWHRISKKEAEKTETWGAVVKKYKQPAWCAYPDALAGLLGCWSLIMPETRQNISKKFCENCEYYNGQRRK